MWLVTRYRDAQEVLRGDGTIYSAVGQTAAALAHLPADQRAELSQLGRVFSAGLLWSDPPDHTRIRSVVNKVMRPRDAEQMRPRIDEIVAEILDAIDTTQPFDLVSSFAALLPVTVLAELLGIPSADIPRFRVWADTLAKFLGSPRPTLELALAAQETVSEAREFIDWLAEERRKQPADDVVSRLIAAEAADPQLIADELHATIIVLLIGGHRTTTALIGNGMLALLLRPESLRDLRDHPTGTAQAVEEFFRYDSPHQRTIRICRRDTSIGGQPIAAGEVVAVLNGAANRDPEQFHAPDELVLDRSPNRHLGLSAGIHFCIGAPLARIEASAAIGGLLNRFPELELKQNSPAWLENYTLRTVTSLRVGVG